MQSRLLGLRTASHKVLVLAYFLFNICMHNLPATIARKFAYAGDLAILPSANKWHALEGTLTQDMATLSSYLQK